MKNQKKPYEMKIIKRKENGGGVVRMKILGETDELNLYRTATRTKKKISLDGEAIAQMISNFDKFPGPVGVRVGHIPKEIQGTFPALGNIEAVQYKPGEGLVADIDFNREGFRMMIEDQEFAGASVEIIQNPEYATGKLEGWVLEGLAIVNDPSTDVYNKVAASKEYITADNFAQLSIHNIEITDDTNGGTENMTNHEMEQRIKDLEAEVAEANRVAEARDEEVTQLSKEKADLEAEVDQLKAEYSQTATLSRAKMREYEEMVAKNKDLDEKVAHLSRKIQDSEIVNVVESALESGRVTQEEVAGYSDSPSAWLSKNFGESFTVQMLDALYAKRQPSVNLSRKYVTGKAGSEVALSRAERDELEKAKINPRFATVRSYEEFKRIQKAQS